MPQTLLSSVRRAVWTPRVAAAFVLIMIASGALCDPAVMVVSSTPTNAKVFVNGYFKGFTPARVEIGSVGDQSKQYRFTLVLAGYKKWELETDLRSGSNKSINAWLEPLPTALSGPTICIDPGHPSETSAGCTGPTGVSENHINWVIALKLKQALTNLGARVVLTKSSENENVTNRRRAEIANAAGADIMLRLHCDAAPNPGFALYYPDRAGTKYGQTGPPASVRDASRTAADAMYRGMKQALTGHVRPRGLHGDSATYIGSKQGALTGSIFAQVPVVTIEMCVLTVASDERFINSAAGQQKMVEALLAGLETYFGERNSGGGCKNCPDT